MSNEERLAIANKLLDAAPGALTAREILTLGEMYHLRCGWDDNWLKRMDRIILPDPDRQR